MAYLVLARKWRPQTLDDLTGQEHVARILKNALASRKVAHAYIFSGPRGVGKTTTARILAKALNCVNGPTPEPCGHCPVCVEVAGGASVDVSEIDGASNTGVDNIRDLRERVRYAPSGARYKIYIIDEAHMLSTSAFNALLKTLEEPPPHVVFVLATTEPKKIPPTVLSRCQHLPFTRITVNKIKERLKSISEAEGISIAPAALDIVARAADGSMRDSLTILDQVTSFSDTISAEDVKDLLGITDVETLSRITGGVIGGDRKGIISLIAGLTSTGTDLKSFTRDLLQFVRNLLVAKIVDGMEETMDVSEEEARAIASLKEKTSEEHMALLLSELIKAEPGIRSAFYPRIALEMTLIRLSLLSHFKAVDEALRALGGAEDRGGPQGSRPGTPLAEDAPPARRSTGREASRQESAGKKGQRSEKALPRKGTEELSPVLQEAAPAEEPAPVPHTSDSPLADVWSAAVEKIDETNHPLASKLREAVFSANGTEITLTFNGGFSVHADSVRESLPLVAKTLGGLCGKTVDIVIGTAQAPTASRKDLKEKVMQNPVVLEALELFEGRIVDIIPIKKGGDNV
ncbi:MAG: DNA polymerase III subunit gamma/tau [Nitrospirales bacterium]|nr:DNA polymerase III subunit gamma/tau [Nitrospirales bacterium]